MQWAKWIEILLAVSGLIMCANSKAIIPIEQSDQGKAALNRAPIFFGTDVFIKPVSEKSPTAEETNNVAGVVVIALSCIILGIIILLIVFYFWCIKRNRLPLLYSWCWNMLPMILGHTVQA